MGKKELISFVIPCYNSTNTLDIVVTEIQSVMKEKLKEYNYEIILVNDGSPDGTTFHKIREIAAKNSSVKGINLARNFGQPSAVMAALNHVQGDYIVCGDDDGQTPFTEVPLFLEKIKAGYDIVEAKYTRTEKKTLFRRFGTYMNEHMATWLINKPDGIVLTTFWIIRKFVKDEMIRYRNPYPYLGGLLMRVSQNVCNIEVTRKKRVQGKSNYSFIKMLKLWLNGFTSFSVKPLRLSSIFGLILAVASFIYGIAIFIKKLLNPSMSAGYASIFIVILVLFGFMFVFIGLLGEYVGRIYMSLNNSPQYIIRENINIQTENE